MSFTKFTLTDSAAASDIYAADTSTMPDLALVREHDYGRSLMDRAQRQRHAQTDFSTRAQALLQQAATSPLPQEAQLAALDRQSEQLADAERTQLGYRRLREAYKADALELSLKAISAISDPIDQRQQLTQLRSRYAPFALNPELAQRIDTQFDTVEPVVQRNEQALALRSVRSGRYAPTLAEARQAFPGRRVHTYADPASGTTLFFPGDGADPHQEAEAIQLIENAAATAESTGDLTELQSLRDDEIFRSVVRVPGNRVSSVYVRALRSLLAPKIARAKTVDRRATEDYIAPPGAVVAAPPQEAAAYATEAADFRGRREALAQGRSFKNADGSVTTPKKHFHLEKVAPPPRFEEGKDWTPRDKLAAEFARDAYGEEGERGGLLGALGIPYAPQDGFAAALYYGPDGRHYLAFRGTDDVKGDIPANAEQALIGRTSQYEQATALSRQVLQKLREKGALKDDGDLVLVGHSLGGGLASAGAYATGLSAVTLNAAGLNGLYQKGTPGDIRAHYIEDEALTRLQNKFTFLPAPAGTRIAHPPARSDDGMFARHGSAQFVDPAPKRIKLPPRLK